MTRPLCPRALPLAEAANPEWVWDPLGGWSLARSIILACFIGRLPDATGCKVPMSGRAAVITSPARRLLHLVDHFVEVAQKGQAAMARALALVTWDRKAEPILDISRRVMTPGLPRPAPFGPG